jgi:myo-inositol-1-phosphate synthase
VAIVGVGGAVASTAVAGVALLRRGAADHRGLPLAELPPSLAAALVPYEALEFAGWDLDASDLAAAAAGHRVLDPAQLDAARDALSEVRPWPAVGSARWCRNVDGRHRRIVETLRDAVAAIRADLAAFREARALDAVVMVNLASTEATPDVTADCFATPEAFEAALDADDARIPPAALYAYAAIVEGVPYANFTPSVAADLPALAELARRRGVPVAGKDGKTGQTFVKTVLAPALRDRALHVDGWCSHNILGNRDGEALRDPSSLRSKLDTKAAALDAILGYPVEDHVVTIQYYRPRGDDKEAWDTIDLTGFLGRPMQLKLNFLCRDSILAAPLALELARLLDLAQRTGDAGVQEQLGAFFKSPATRVAGAVPEHAFPEQQRRLLSWLESAAARVASEAEVPLAAIGDGMSDARRDGATDDLADDLLDAEHLAERRVPLAAGGLADRASGATPADAPDGARDAMDHTMDHAMDRAVEHATIAALGGTRAAPVVLRAPDA